MRKTCGLEDKVINTRKFRLEEILPFCWNTYETFSEEVGVKSTCMRSCEVWLTGWVDSPELNTEL